MKFTSPCMWDKADTVKVYDIGRYTHIAITNVGFNQSQAMIVLDLDKARELANALFAHVEAYAKNTPVKTTPATYASLSDQAKTVYRHMDRAGSISAREAMDDYGMTSATLARRICDIEEEGFMVIRDRRIHPITQKRYTRYALDAAPAGAN